MSKIDRRSALVLGVATAGSALFPADKALGQSYRPDEGTEIAPGVRAVKASERQSMHGRDSVLPAYKKIVVFDVIFQPGAKEPDDGMKNDMVCLCIDGQMQIDHRDGHAFTVKKGDVWTCLNREPEDVENTGSTPAIMPVIHLMPA